MTPLLSRDATRRAGVALALGLFCLVGALAVLNFRALRESADWIAHTQDALAYLAEVGDAATDLESRFQEYMLAPTGERRTALEDVLATVPPLLGELAVLLEDSAAQMARLETLRERIMERETTMEAAVALRWEAGIEEALAVAGGGVGVAQRQAIQEALRELRRAERAILAERSERAAGNARNTLVITAAALLAGLGVLMLVYTFLAREIRQRRGVQQELEEARAALERRVDERTRELQAANAQLREESRERLNAEQAALNSEGRFRAFMDNSYVLAYMKDEEGRYVYVNNLWENYFGKTEAEWRGRNDAEIWGGDTHAALTNNDRIVLEENAPRQFYESAPTADGTVLYGLSMKFPVTGPSGERYLGGISMDITSRMEAEQAIRRSEERFNLATRAANEVIYEWRVGPNTVWWSDGVKRLFGYEHDGGFHPASVWLDRIHPEDRDAIIRGMDEAMARGDTVWTGEYRFARADGGYVRIVDRGMILYEDGPEGPKADRMVGAMLDVTSLKETQEALEALNAELEQRVEDRTEQLEQANRELEAFAYSVSHDLRAPLRAIDGFSRATLEDYGGSLPEEGRDFLRRICRAANEMGTLIDDLLDLSRIGRRPLRGGTVRLGEIARRVQAKLTQEAPDREVEWIIADPPPVTGDPGLLQVALYNLFANAWKFTGKNEAATIQFGYKDDPAAGVVYFVSDNGAGFDRRFADKLFGPFQRLHSRDEFPGTGVGLATVQRVIHRHGGSIWAEGAPGEGAAFYFTLALPQENGDDAEDHTIGGRQSR